MKYGLNWKKDNKPNAGETSLFNEPATFHKGVYQIHENVWAWMQPNGSWGESNAGVISSNGETLVWDSLYDLRLTKSFLNEIEPITRNAPIKTLVNSHSNADHTYGNELFKGAEILSSEKCAHEMPSEPPSAAAMLPKLGKAISCCGLGGMPLWPLRKWDKVGKYFTGISKPYYHKGITLTLPTKTFNNHYKGQVGNIPYELIEVGPAHTDGDILLYLPEQKIVFAGDILFIEGLPAAWNPGIKDWLDAIEVIEKLDVETIVPGHGKIIGKDGLDDLKSFFVQLLQKTEYHYKNGMKPYNIAEHLLLEDQEFSAYRLWDCPERTVMATTTYSRVLDGNMEHYSGKDKLGVLWGVGKIAMQMPNAAPKSLHMKL